MMKIPLSYIARNLWARRLTTVLTAAGLALVVFVFATVLMLDAGLKKTLVSTGEYNNVVMIRRAAETEVQSSIDREQANIAANQPAIALGHDGRPLVSKETVVLIALNKRGTEKPANVVIRGISPSGLALRPQVVLTAGRMFRPGSSEIIAGSGIAKRFTGAGIGETLRFGQREWTVAGTFDAGNSGFDSEIWGDADQLMQAFRRTSFSSVIVRLERFQPDCARRARGDLPVEQGASTRHGGPWQGDATPCHGQSVRDRPHSQAESALGEGREFESFKKQIESDQRLTLEAKREQSFYADQSKALSTFISVLGMTLSIVFSIGAMIGAMITMYASVANRVAEIGTLRALGFKRRNILTAFLTESLLLSLGGWVAGLSFASLMQLISFSTINFQSFSELAFGFTLTPAIAVESLLFALAMGFIGGFLPAYRAARMKIVDSLRAA